MLTKPQTAKQEFLRDKLTWLCYIMIATYCYCSAALGPLMSFLATELKLNYKLVSYHFSSWAFGVVLAGFIGDKCSRRLGKHKAVWLACLGLCSGVSTITLAQSPVATISGAFLCGIFGSIMSQTLCTIIAERFVELRAVAITEANIVASLCCSIAPLSVSLFSRSNVGWRGAYVVPVLAFLIYFVWANGLTKDFTAAAQTEAKAAGAKLPQAYWLCWVLVFLSVASEWSLIYWSADFLEKVAKLVKSDAAACVSSFLVAMVTGRIIGSRLAREIRPKNLLRGASLAALAGFCIFWMNKSAPICIIGLFITGLGISNFYPLTLSLAIESAPGLTAKATARMSLASGSSTLTAPLLLGMIAESRGIFAAYALIAALLVLCTVTIFLPIWSEKKESAAPA